MHNKYTIGCFVYMEKQYLQLLCRYAVGDMQRKHNA